MKPYYDHAGITIYHGDCREVLPTLDPVDLVLTDPPYSSGGMTRSDRNQRTSDKYRMTGVRKVDPDFRGDNRDQRSFELWCSYWMGDAFRITRDGGAFACFIDWRNLPCVVDAVQVAGWVYRGILVWDKTEGSRPMKGWFRNQAEYVVLSSSGVIDRDSGTGGICQAGVLRKASPGGKKLHLTEKPVEVLREIVKTRDDWSFILDPFMGGGTTLRAAKDLGRKAIGIEIEERYCEIAAKRLAQEVLPFTNRNRAGV